MRRFIYLLIVLAIVFFGGLALGYFFPVFERKETVLSIESAITPTVQIEETKLLLGGDVMLGRSVRNATKAAGNANYPFEKTAEFLGVYDLAFVNLENPIVTDCPFHDGGFKFCSDFDSISSLKHGQIDIVNIANNHTYNYGSSGFAQTKKFLEESGILYTGDSKLTVKKIGNTTFGFLGFDFTVKKPTEADYDLIAASDPQVDTLIVSPHWGVEYKANPEQYQREWAKIIIEKGADVITGTHPHWVQGADCIKGGGWQYYDREVMAQSLDSCEKVVFYSLGNFVFDQMWSEETKKGILAEIQFQEGKIAKINIVKTYIKVVGQPIIVE